jgi:hypothetical protein
MFSLFCVRFFLVRHREGLICADVEVNSILIIHRAFIFSIIVYWIECIKNGWIYFFSFQKIVKNTRKFISEWENAWVNNVVVSLPFNAMRANINSADFYCFSFIHFFTKTQNDGCLKIKIKRQKRWDDWRKENNVNCATTVNFDNWIPLSIFRIIKKRERRNFFKILWKKRKSQKKLRIFFFLSEDWLYFIGK